MRKNKNVPTIRYALEEKYKNLGKDKTYYIFTYGCQGNEADSEVMAGILEEIGYTKSMDREKLILARVSSSLAPDSDCLAPPLLGLTCL